MTSGLELDSRLHREKNFLQLLCTDSRLFEVQGAVLICGILKIAEAAFRILLSSTTKYRCYALPKTSLNSIILG